MKPGPLPVSPIALGIGVVVLLLAALSPGRADAAGDAVPGERGASASISVR